MPRARHAGFLLVALALIGLIVSIPAMAQRLANRGGGVVWFHDPIPAQDFTFLGAPASVHTVDPPLGVDQRPTLVVTWRGETTSVEIEKGIYDDPRLPGLLRHDDWLRILVMAEGARSREELDRKIAEGSVQPRLVIAMRFPAENYDPGSWGSVRRREWRYRFLELLPESRSPEKKTEWFEGTYADLDKLGDPAYVRSSGRESEVWKYAAMQHVTPTLLFRSKNKSIDDAMRAMGWTWPLAGVSIMALVVGALIIAVAPSRASGGA